jgi:hypothetical protein
MQWVLDGIAVKFQCVADNRNFSSPRLRTDPGPHSDRNLRVDARQRGKQCGGRRGIADTDFAECDNIAIGARVNGFGACLHRLQSLFDGPRRFPTEIPRPKRDLSVNDAMHTAEIVCNTDVDHSNVGTGTAGQDIGGTSARDKAVTDVRRHIGTVRADTFFRNTVIAREDQQRLSGNGGTFSLLDSGQSKNDIFETAQAAVRKQELIETCACPGTIVTVWIG